MMSRPSAPVSTDGLHLGSLLEQVTELAHALAAPLQVASGYLSLAARTSNDGEAVERAQAAVLRAAQLLPMLEATAIAAAPPRPASLDPSRLLTDVATTLERQHRFRGEIRTAGSGWVHADLGQLAIAFDQLLLERQPRSVVTKVQADRWQLLGLGCAPPTSLADGAAATPLWQRIVERQGGCIDADGTDVRLWLPLERRE